MTSDKSTQPLSSNDETIGSTFRQECLQMPIPTQDMRVISDRTY